MSHGPGKICILASLVFCAYLGFSPRIVLRECGAQLNFNQYQAGSEHTTLVPNGNFETGDTTDWTPSGDVAIAAPINPPTPTSTTGSFAFQSLVGSPTDTNPDTLTSTTTFTFDPNQKYVLRLTSGPFRIMLRSPCLIRPR